MNKKELLSRIEWMLSYNDEGDAGVYSFSNNPEIVEITPKTYEKCLKGGTVEFFLSAPKEICHSLYELYRSDYRITTVTTYSYKLSLYNLSAKELTMIYKAIKPYCKHNGKLIYK